MMCLTEQTKIIFHAITEKGWGGQQVKVILVINNGQDCKSQENNSHQSLIMKRFTERDYGRFVVNVHRAIS